MVRKYENMSTDYPSFLNPKDIPILQNFIKLSVYDKPLDIKYIQILNYLLKNPDKSTKDVEKSSLTGLKGYSCRTIYRYTDDLCNEYKLIELVTEKMELIKGTNTKYKKPYRLSLDGIFYIIINTFDISYDDLVKSLASNYKNNILFSLFLYPFIKVQTIESIVDSGIFSIIALYLRDICKVIVEDILALKNMVLTTPDGYIVEQVFVWPNDLKDFTIEFCDVNLRHFLKMTLKWDWVKDAKITYNFNENGIDIIYPPDYQKDSHISIHKSEKKAVLRQQGKKVYEFSINPYKSFLSIESRTDRKRLDSMDTLLIYRCKEHLLTFLNKLRTQITPYNQSFDILQADENFKKAIEYMDNEIKLK